MGKNSKIPWTDHTFNPWWGCVKVSPGCTNCYADAFDHRLGGEHWGPKAPRKFFGDKHWQQPMKWNRAAEEAGERHKVFCASMCDVFERHVDIDTDQLMGDARWRLWRLIDTTPHLDWLLLTKRPKNVAEMVPAAWLLPEHHPHNVWLGTTMEDQAAHNDRLNALLAAKWPAKRFVSYEPALGPIAFSGLSDIDWVIVGAESGPKARTMEEDWVRSARDQCQASGVPFMYKQRLEDGKKVELPMLDGKQWAESPR